MEEVATKQYEALQDFTLPSVNPETGEPAGDVSYSKGEKYNLPPEVAALAPEGALKDVEAEVTPPVETTPPTMPGASTPAPEAPAQAQTTPAPAPEAPAQTAPTSHGFVGGHTLRDN